MCSAINHLYDEFNGHNDFDKYIKWTDYYKKWKNASRLVVNETQADFTYDVARDTWYSFYENFMIYWKIGRLNIEDLAGIDWPSAYQIKLFIKLVEPLDYFYFTMVIGGKHDDWEREYEVYTFLREFLALKGHNTEPVDFKFTKRVPILGTE